MIAMARMTPTSSGRATGRALARLGLALRPRERAQAEANLVLAFPDSDQAWRRDLIRRAADRLGDTLHDSLTVDRWLERHRSLIIGDDALTELRRCRNEGRGVLVLTGHLGCWELLGGWLARMMDGLTVVVGEIHNEPVDRLVNDRRRRLGMAPVPRDGDLRPLLRALRDGGVAAVLMDQATKVPSRDVPFFGHPAPTATGFASLALRTGAPILPMAIERLGRGHRVVTGTMIDPRGYDGVDPTFDLLLACNKALEDLVRRNPAEWVWFHRRWPDERPEPK